MDAWVPRAMLTVALVLSGCAPAASPCPVDDASASDAVADPTQDAALVSLAFVPSEVGLTVCERTRSDLQLVGQGTSPTGPLAPTIAGPDAATFAIVASTCAGGVLPGQTCALTIEHTPTSDQDWFVASVHVRLGDRTIRAVVDNARPYDCPARPIVDPVAHDFGALTVGGTTTLVLTIRNAGRATSSPLSVALEGADSGAYAIVPGTDHCSGTTLADHASCTVEVAFTPVTSGEASVVVRPSSTGLSVPAVLTGTGV